MKYDRLHSTHLRLPYILLISLFLILSTSGAGVDAASEPEYRAIITYRIQDGDSLWRLSHSYATTMNQLRADNPHLSHLEPGQVIYITTRVANGTYPYRVSAGESLYIIAQRAGLSIAAIQRANDLPTPQIWAGQTLRVPLADDGEFVEWVRPGDTLHGIAARHNLTPLHLREVNPLLGDEIRVNQILRISQAAGGRSPGGEDENDLLQYRVRPGDTLGDIVTRYKTTAAAVWGTNHLRSNLLMPGQLLYIPVGGTAARSVDGPRGSQLPGYGELLTWELARWYYPPGTDATVIDLYTGQRFSVRRLGGSNHADSEPISARDTAIMYELFGRSWTWAARPILLEVRGRTFAASMAGMPHDVQTIHDNNFNGHFCLYFLDSRSHNTNSIQSHHQSNVLRAAGMQ